MAASIIEIILEEILKIPTDLMFQYTSVADQLIYLILIPTLVVLLFVWTFGGWIAGQHPRFRILITIVSYIFIIYAGWYGAMASFIVSWFALLLGLAFAFFIISRIIHPIRGKAIYELSGAMGKRLKEVTVGKQKEREVLEDQIKDLQTQIDDIEAQLSPARVGSLTPEMRTYSQMKLQELNTMIKRKKRELEKM